MPRAFVIRPFGKKTDSNKQEIDMGARGEPDLTDAQLAGPMRNGSFVGECGAPDPMKVTVKVAIKQGLFGQAVHLTNKALALEPTDRNALLVQGEAMVEMGAAPRARENLAKIQKLCGTAACPQAIQLGATISRGPQMASATKKSAEEPKKN